MMERVILPGKISIRYYDKTVEQLLVNTESKGLESSFHYTQSESFFLKLNQSFKIPHLPIHHDIYNPKPTEFYLESLKNVLKQIIPHMKTFFEGMTYFFTPTEILKPSFFQLYKIQGRNYLYIFQIDLLFRPQCHELVEQGDNDITAVYETDRIFMDAHFIPLSEVTKTEDGANEFIIDETVSQTWIGETGRGYFVQGIWMDNELTKFFSKIILPSGKRYYPYYPFICKYKTICQSVIQMDMEGRKANLPIFHRYFDFIKPRMEYIQKSIKAENFNEAMPIFKEIRSLVPMEWIDFYNAINVSAYLNEDDMKEFKVELNHS